MSKIPGLFPPRHFVIFRSSSRFYNLNDPRIGIFLRVHVRAPFGGRGRGILLSGKRSGEVENFPDRCVSVATADETKLFDHRRFRGRSGSGGAPCVRAGGGRPGSGRMGRGASQPPMERRDAGVGGDHPKAIYRSRADGEEAEDLRDGASDHEPGNQGRARHRPAHRQSGGGHGPPRSDRQRAGRPPVRAVVGSLPGHPPPLLSDQHPRSGGGGGKGAASPGSGVSREWMSRSGWIPAGTSRCWKR